MSVPPIPVVNSRSRPMEPACRIHQSDQFVRNPSPAKPISTGEEFRKVVAIFTRMLDNVVEINGLPLKEQRDEIMRKTAPRHGISGLGSSITMLQEIWRPGLDKIHRQVTRELAMVGWQTGLDLARERTSADHGRGVHRYHGNACATTRDGCRQLAGRRQDKGKVLHARYSRYMQQVASENPELVRELERDGCRFSHHSSIAPTGTISLSLANNASNGIEPSFAHHYARNLSSPGEKSRRDRRFSASSCSPTGN